MKFRPAGKVLSAKIVPPPAFSRVTKKAKGARAAGLAYERKAKAFLEETYPLCACGVWFEFVSESGQNFCQPDALHFDFTAGTLTIIEIKLRHCDLAWWQLNHLYQPVCEVLFPEFKCSLVEMVKWYDVETPISGPHKLSKDLILPESEGQMRVHIWNP